MRKLSKEQLARRDEICAEVNEASEDLNAAVNAFNETVKDAFGEVVSAQETLNEALQKMRDFASNVASEIEGYMSEKSDGWHDSEKGQNYQSWLDEWQNFSPDDEDIEQPEDIEANNSGEEAVGELEALPEEVD